LQDWKAPGAAFVFFCALLLALGPNARAFSAEIPDDFAAAVYYPSRAFLDGICPYDAASYAGGYPPYLPGALLLHLPFALLPPGPSAFLYTLVSVGLILLLAYLSLRMSEVSVSRAAVLLIATAILVSRPGRMNLLLGQVTLEMVLASYVALSYAQTRPWVSALGLSVAILKPTFGVPLALLMLARRNLRAVLLGAAFTTIVNLPLLSILAHEVGGVAELGEHLSRTVAGFQSSSNANVPALSASRVDAVSLLSRFWGRSLGAAAQVLVAGVVIGVAWVALRRTRQASNSGQALSAGVVCTAVLLSVYHQVYDLLLLTMPFLALAYRRLPRPYDAPGLRWALLTLFTFLTLNYAAGRQVLKRLGFVVAAGAGQETIVLEPVALILVSLNGLALLAIFVICAGMAVRGGVSRPPQAPASA
jgi:hypothetical protein